MKPLTIDQMPESLASLHDKADRIIEMLTMLTNGKPGGDSHVPVGLSEACRILGKSRSTIYEMTSKRTIPFHKRGNKLYFFKDELFEWIRDGGRSALPSDQDMEEELSHGIRHKPMSSFDRTNCYPS